MDDIYFIDEIEFDSLFLKMEECMMSYVKYSMFLLSLLYATAGWTMDADLQKDVARSSPHRSVPLRDPSSYLTALFPKDLLFQLALYLKDQPKHGEAVSSIAGTDITDNPLYWREKCKILLDRHRLDPLHSMAGGVFKENLVPAHFKSIYAFLDSLFSIPDDKRSNFQS